MLGNYGNMSAVYNVQFSVCHSTMAMVADCSAAISAVPVSGEVNHAKHVAFGVLYSPILAL